MDYPPIYSKVFGRLQKVRCSESGAWSCLCPAHEDRTPSMTLRVGDTGCLLIKCHRNNGDGCSLGDILAAIDCTTADVFPEREERQAHRNRTEATYDYRDEGGVMLFQVSRYRDKDGFKRYFQRRPNPDHDAKEPFLYDMKDVRRVLYRLPELIAAKASASANGRKAVVMVVEGERCVEAIRTLGYTATTSSGAAGKFAMTDYSHLIDCHVVVLPDNDARDHRVYKETGRETWTGQSHAEEVCRLVYPLAASVRYVDLPGSPIKGDIADWILHRDLVMMPNSEMIAELDRVVAREPFWVPPGQPHPFFAAAETASRAENFVSVKKWKHAVEGAASDLRASNDPAEMKRILVRLGAVALSGAESYFGMRRPQRSLPVLEDPDEEAAEAASEDATVVRV